jgi:hypothetical protein
MFPSKMRPTSSPARLITGDPELPPMMSASATKLSGVDIVRRARRSSQRFVRLNGGVKPKLAARSYKP